MRDFYERFYTLAPTSPAHSEFCQRVFGADLCQHGFVDMAQLNRLIDLADIRGGQHVLDIGCGVGMIAEYISDVTGAYVTGLDYIPVAIETARQRTASKSNRLQFMVGDINTLHLVPHSFNFIFSLDSIYFSNDYPCTIRQLAEALKSDGRLAFYYGHGREPWVPIEEFDAATLAPDCTPLAQALIANGIPFETIEFTEADYRLAKRRQAVLTELRPMFEAEGTLFIYENRMGDAMGMADAMERGLHRRYLYLCGPMG